MTLSALFPFSWTSTIVDVRSSISTTKTFDFSCARIRFVIRLSAGTIHFTTDLTTPPSIERACFSDSSIERAISLNCGSVKFRPF